MTRKPMVVELLLPVAGIFLLTLAGLGWFAVSSLDHFFASRMEEDLQARAQLLAARAAGLVGRVPAPQVQGMCQDLGRSISTRLTLVLPDGKILCDSEEDPARLDNHINRPEIQDALHGKTGTDIRRSSSLKEERMYAAVPVRQKGRIVAAARTALPLGPLRQATGRLAGQITLAGLGFVLMAGAIVFFLSRDIRRQMNRFQTGTVRFGKGDFRFHFPVTGPRELAGLAKSLNSMGAQLNDRIQTLTRQRNEQETILTSMVEGVFAVDREERMIHLNLAAGHLFKINPGSAQGRPLHEVIRNSQLQDFVKHTLESTDSQEADIELTGGDRERYLQVRGTLLQDTRSEAFGAVFVLHDVTRLRRLETMRRDFVANVSHELKTPITSIKGFVETLLDGAMDSEKDARRFLEIVAKQSDRLNSIIEDLLTLSRIEQESERGGIVIQECRVREVLENAVSDCTQKAWRKEIHLNLDCDADLTAQASSPLLEEAVVNLVDNAIKYSDPQKQVDITAGREDGMVVIRVADRGRGIHPEHLPRLFERFYRVDKARSRQMGGTGLGLAIVKHIAQAHRGKVDVESAPGAGSTFSIHLPET